MTQEHKIFLNQSFHDVPVIGLKINFEEESLDLFIALNNEEKDDYDYLHLVFLNVKNLSLVPFEMDFDNDTMIDIYQSEFKEINGAYRMYFLFLLGFGKPSMDVKFDFGEFSLQKVEGEAFF